MTKKILAILLALMLVLPCLASCNGDNEPSPKPTEAPTDAPTEKPTEGNANSNGNNNSSNNNNNDNQDPDDEIVEVDPFENGMKINGIDISEFSVIYASQGTTSSSAKTYATEFVEWVKDNVNVELTLSDDTAQVGDKEILFGDTNRPESAESKGDGFDSRYEFSALLKDSKLAITASHKNGYRAALGSFKNSLKASLGNLTSAFTVNSVSLEDINKVVAGAIRHEITTSGLRLHKATQQQIDNWTAHTRGWEYNTQCPQYGVGMRIDFDTDSSFFSFKVSAGTCVVLVNDELVVNGVKEYYCELDTDEETNRVTILLPTGNTNNWTVTELVVDGGAKVEKHKTDLNMLFLGDSITEGYNNHGHPASTFPFYTYTYFNADAVVQGHSGSQIWTDMLDPALADLYDPDLIIIALGTNDYANGCKANDLKSRMNTYLDKLQQIYPDAEIVGVTPIKRLNKEMTQFDSNLAAANKGLEDAFEAHGCFVVDGETLLSEVDEYADYVHPNEDGFLVYGENLCAAIEDLVLDIIANK